MPPSIEVKAPSAPVVDDEVDARELVIVINVVGRLTLARAVVAGGNRFNERLTQRRLAQPKGRDVAVALGVMAGRMAEVGSVTAGRVGLDSARVTAGSETEGRGMLTPTPTPTLALIDRDN